jgi:UDP-N-acetylglucosamine--N-acetylmuramyl-(pentapeptide) pyrophosphoryl-undecaprenol N-acetylglucosamine transferase
MAKKIIIAGGGTGGHIFPAVAIANAIKKIDPSADILFVGARGKMEMEKVPQAGYKIIGLDIAGFNRSSLIKNIGLPLKLVKSFFQVRKIVNEFKPDAVIGVGGYSSFPVLRYAQAKSISTYIHEANSYGGKSNVLLGKKATRVFVGGDGMEKFFPAEKTMVTGNPVRDSIVKAVITKEEAVAFFKLDPAKAIVLVTGGSLGARGINEAIAAKLGKFKENGLQLIWQTGKAFHLQAKELAEGQSNIWVNDFITKMEYAYTAADIVVSRAGAMAIAELCVVRKPVVFVPFPFAAEDHQTVNAMKLVNKKAGLMVTDKEAAGKLVEVVAELAKDKNKQEELKQNISKLAVTDADEVIAKEVLRGSKVLLNDGE